MLDHVQAATEAEYADGARVTDSPSLSLKSRMPRALARSAAGQGSVTYAEESVTTKISNAIAAVETEIVNIATVQVLMTDRV